MSNKTISINPSLFSMGGLKTKKNREKNIKPKVVPLISPNVLKKKLLNRIREHKNKEIKNLNTDSNNKTPVENNKENATFSDEFNESINYLQTLTAQKKINKENEKYEIQKQKRKQELEKKTVKNYASINGGGQPIVNIDLPEELSEPVFKVNTEQFTPNIQLNPKPYTVDNIPYGVLKGGQKITYRNWLKNQDNTNSFNNLTIQGEQLDKQKSERENRLGFLREKLKNKQIEEAIKVEEKSKISNSTLTPSLIEPRNSNTANINNLMKIPINTVNTSNTVNTITGGEKIIGTKKIIKKTIKKKYTLGKSKIKKTVGVLIKDRGTRKQVLTAQKDLKRKSINEIKEYLRDHNLIKAGSNAPNDVVRKLYETSMLAGDITNSNTEILLHNFSKDDKEL